MLQMHLSSRDHASATTVERILPELG